MKVKFEVVYIGPSSAPGRFRVILMGCAGQRMELDGIDADQVREFTNRDQLGQPHPADTQFFIEAARASSEEKTLKP